MAFDFPNSPTTGDIASTPSGPMRWDGVKWTGGAGVGSNYVPQLGPSSIGVAVVDSGNTATDRGPTLTGLVTPYNATSDYIKIGARRLTTPVNNSYMDGGQIALTGPSYPTAGWANGCIISTGTAAGGYRSWIYGADGSLNAPGSLTTSGQITAGTSVAVTGTLLIDPYNGWEWYKQRQAGSGDHIEVHRSGYYTQWFNSNGTFRWVFNNAAALDISSNTQVTAYGSVTSLGGRFISQLNSVPSVTVYSPSQGVATCMFLWTDNVLHWGAANASGGYVGPSFMNLDRSGNLNVTGNLTTTGQVISNGNMVAQASLYVGNATVGSTYVFYVSGGHRYHQYSTNWYWDWDGNTGNLSWIVGGTGGFWNLRAGDWKAFNGLGATGGYGAYENYACDARIKREIKPATEGLDEILMLEPVTFRKLKHDGSLPEARELGFIAQDVRNVIPQAVMESYIDLPPGAREDGDDTPSLGLDTTPIIAACVRAIQQLTARIATLEGRA